jgi:DNA-binding transcriptional LysR family regulator
MSGFDLNLLPVFNMLMEERSVTATGDRLGRTQSAISAALKRLRDTFEDPLFLRTAQGLEPTRKALALYEKTSQIAELSRECTRLEATFDPRSDRTHVVIGAPDRLSLPVMLPFLRHVRDRAPGISIDLRTADRGRALELVLSKDLDLAIGSFDDVPKGVESAAVFDEPLLAVFAPSHPLASGCGPVPIEELVRHEHLVVTSGGVPGAVFDRVLNEMGMPRQQRVSISNFIITPDLLQDGDLVGVFTRRVAQVFLDRHGLQARELPPDIPAVAHSMIWHKRMDADAAHRWLREQLQAICLAPVP